MLTRLATGLVLAPLVIWLVVWGPGWGVALLVLVAALLCLNELYAMGLPEGATLERAAGVLAGAGLLVAFHVDVSRLLPWAVAAALAGPGIAVLIRAEPLSDAGQRLMILWGGLAYVAGSFLFVLHLALDPGHIMLAFAVVWLGDTGAYFVGRAIGRHKLYPAVSPKKTWEGAAGGLLASVGGAFLIRAWLLPDLPIDSTILLAVVAGCLAQVGDLVESLLKRTWGVKDSGNILPGHGGMLDRVDGFLFAAPFLAVALP